jgi:protein-tyrosine phosphatase
MSADQPPAERVRILTVCTGNICRSPYAQVVLGAALEWARPGAFDVTSAGTHALVDYGVDPGSAALLDAKGLRHDTFRARRLTPALLAQQDVVLVMAAHHKEYVVDEAPAVHRRTFTLRELAGALEDIEENDDWPSLLSQAGAHDVLSRWRALPAILAAHRPRGRRRGERDVADPYQRGERAFARMVGEIDPAVRSIVSWERRLGH